MWGGGIVYSMVRTATLTAWIAVWVFQSTSCFSLKVVFLYLKNSLLKYNMQSEKHIYLSEQLRDFSQMGYTHVTRNKTFSAKAFLNFKTRY